MNRVLAQGLTLPAHMTPRMDFKEEQVEALDGWTLVYLKFFKVQPVTISMN